MGNEKLKQPCVGDEKNGGNEREGFPINKSQKKPLFGYDHMLCRPIGHDRRILPAGFFGFLGVLCADTPLSPNAYRDDARHAQIS